MPSTLGVCCSWPSIVSGGLGAKFQWAGGIPSARTPLGDLASRITGLPPLCLPVWIVLAPRDYLTNLLKIGTIVLLALCTVGASAPILRVDAVTDLPTTRPGPVFAGGLFPIPIRYYRLRRASPVFHALIAVRTPQEDQKESEVRLIGYGAMLAESSWRSWHYCRSIIDPPASLLLRVNARRAPCATAQTHQPQ